MPDTYTYWRVGLNDDVYLRRSAAGCDILESGQWQPVDVAKYGAPDPWANKILEGEAEQLELSEVPVTS